MQRTVKETFTVFDKLYLDGVTRDILQDLMKIGFQAIRRLVPDMILDILHLLMLLRTNLFTRSRKLQSYIRE
ncbi:hypothetical protein V8C37DRAFT_397470 [Trichoderma ceciliae]